MPEVSAHLYDSSYGGSPNTLEKSWGRQWQDRMSEPGAFAINLQNDDADLALCDFGDVIRFNLDGTVAFAGVIEGKTVQRADRGEEADQFTTLKGRGTASLFDAFVVYPEAAFEAQWTDTRLFNFSSIEFDDSAWGFAVEIEQGTGDVGGPRAGFPVGLPAEAETAWWIWSIANDINGSVPAGDAYFRKTYTSPGEFVRIVITADNSHEFYLDGQLVETDTVNQAGGVGWAGIKQIDRFLTAGDHVFAVKATNLAGVDPNPSGFILAVIQLTDAGSAYGNTVLVSDDSWKCLGYPASPPGFTPGRVLEILRAEAVARGCAVPTLGFSASVDSAGTAWPVSPDISFHIGAKGLPALLQMAETYVDFAMDPATLTLDAWVHGSKGGPTSTEFEPAVNVMAMVHEAHG